LYGKGQKLTAVWYRQATAFVIVLFFILGLGGMIIKFSTIFLFKNKKKITLKT
jgi:hypothetical protein